ncbi:SseB family protein [uncultured Roseobacter sp.]|uniref:SseB family protein n=1 Tax=uncultured Roseobacter sp. TaxID=114847 RepID=UPI0026281596|nr:SseB family protein [uncultured Roseobacter sp.]
MSSRTPIDDAHAAMAADPEDAQARLRFYDRLSQAELFLMLKQEAGEDDQITPEVFDLGEARYVLVFDREERLARFAGQTTPYVGLSGRSIAGMLDRQGLGVALNPDVAPSAILLPETAVSWLASTLEHGPAEVEAAIEEVHPPTGLPDTLLTALDGKLASATGLAACAYLVRAHYAGGGRGHLLGFVDALPRAHTALARAASEALTFSGIDAGAMDVGFFGGNDPVTDRLAQVGLRFDLPQPPEADLLVPKPPGSDPDKPPRLR